MLSFLFKRWFLLSLTLLIVAGIVLGSRFPNEVKASAESTNPLVTTAIVLFLMSVSLESRQIQAALRAPLPVIVAVLMNGGLAPVLGLACMFLQTTDDFRFGLLVACAVPCTMAAASVWTRKAKGNDAISLLVTMATNLISVVTIPFWLSIATYLFPFTVSQSVKSDLPPGELVDLRQTAMELVIGVLMPLSLGQGCRMLTWVCSIADRHQRQISIASQILILTMVWTAAAKGGMRLSVTQTSITLSSVILVWGSVIVVHAATLFAGLYSARGLGMSRADQIAVAFSGSQKTLPVGLLISEALSRHAGLSFAVFPMLMFHASQLFLDTLIADRFLTESTEP